MIYHMYTKVKDSSSQARLAEISIEERELASVPLEDVRATFNESMVIVGTQLDGLSGRVAGELATVKDPAVMCAVSSPGPGES